jgi:hypothetical protein
MELQLKQEITMFVTIRTAAPILLAALIGLAGPISHAGAQAKQPTVTNVVQIHQTHDNLGKPTGFSAVNPDQNHFHQLITSSNGHQTIVTYNLKPTLVHGKNGQYYAVPEAPTIHSDVHTGNVSISEEKGTKTATYSGTGKSRFHAVYSTQQ